MKRTTATFSPFEISAISGVNPNLQRLWRSRGLMAAAKTPGEYDLNTVIHLTVMKGLSDAGMNLEVAKRSAGVSVMPIMRALLTLSEAGGNLKGADRTCVLATDDPMQEHHEYETFAYVSLEPEEWPQTVRFSGDTAASAFVPKDSPFGILIDHDQVAQRMAAKAGKPFFHFEGEAE